MEDRLLSRVGFDELNDETLIPLDPQPPHYLQQARLVRELKRLRRPRNLPVVHLQCRKHDPPLGVRALRMK
jgi:hypothetical protein